MRALARSGPAVRAAAASTALLYGCVSVDYDNAQVGAFSGSLLVMWLHEGGSSGDGEFLYVPSPQAPLTFVRETAPGVRQTIRPEMMYTDGGSIPSIGKVFKGFSPWGYAPAYMVHDWLFVARHCNRDGTPTPEEARVADMTFEESAQIMAESIKTLVSAGRVAPNDVAAHVIPGAVGGPVARAAWNRDGACAPNRVSGEDRRAAEAAIGARAAGLDFPSDAPRVTVIGEFSF
jgi:hypothetical protein